MAKPNPSPLAAELGHRVRVRRVQLRLSRLQLGEQVGISPAYVGDIERGDRLIKIDTLVALQRGLEMTWEELLGGLSEVPSNRREWGRDR
jgi:transcriptional regulator with XRE-family HTH domain